MLERNILLAKEEANKKSLQNLDASRRNRFFTFKNTHNDPKDFPEALLQFKRT